MKIIGRTNSKQSEPVEINIIVEPVNDQPPVLVNKTIVELWQGGIAQLTNKHLGKCGIADFFLYILFCSQRNRSTANSNLTEFI